MYYVEWYLYEVELGSARLQPDYRPHFGGASTVAIGILCSSTSYILFHVTKSWKGHENLFSKEWISLSFLMEKGFSHIE